MQRFRSMASNGMWMGVLALAATMSFAGMAVAQKKSTSTASTSKSTPAPQQKTTPPPKTTGGGGGTGPARTTGGGGTGPLRTTGGGTVPGRPGGAPPAPSASSIMNLPHPTPGTTRLSNGGSVRVEPNGTKIHYNAQNRPVEMRTPNTVARYDQKGRPSSVRTLNPATNSLQVVHHGPGGVRTAEVVRPARGPGGGMERVVSRGPRNGYLERPVYGRSGFVRRSYLVGDRRYAVNYRGYHYYGVVFYRPVPVIIYSPAYYVWATRSWGAPVAIQVDFVSQPWYASYGRTFVPYDQYSSADEWMTDQILASNMQAAYDAGRDAGRQDANADVPLAPPTISPELKAQFEAQVKQEIQEQGQEAQGGVAGVDPPPATDNEADRLPDALKPSHTVFRVVATLDVDSDGDSCTLNTDDWIVRNGIMNPTTGMVSVTVASSRASDCAQGATAEVSLGDLEAMDTELDGQIRNMMTTASLRMGKGGMPAGPPAGGIPVPGGQAQPDVDVASNLQKEQVDANAAEAQATAPPAPGGQ